MYWKSLFMMAAVKTPQQDVTTCWFLGFCGWYFHHIRCAVTFITLLLECGDLAASALTFFPSNMKAASFNRFLHTGFTLVSHFPSFPPSVCFHLIIYSVSSLSSVPSSLLFSPLLSLSLFHISGWCLSVSLGGFVSPGVNQLADKQFLDERGPRVFGVAAVRRGAVRLNHCVAFKGVNLHQQVKGRPRLLTQHPELYTFC